MASKALAFLFVLCQGITFASAQSDCRDYLCSGVDTCSIGPSEEECRAPVDCDSSTAFEISDDLVQIRGGRCRATLEQIRTVDPDAVSKDDATAEYTLNKDIWVRQGGILEIHGESEASSPDAAVSLLKMKVIDMSVHANNLVRHDR